MATKTNVKDIVEVPTLAELYQSYKQREEDVYASNVARQREIENILATQLGMYQPGGAFEQASLAELAKTKVRDVGATAQRDISRGLYGIRPYEQEWESTVGAPARLRLEDIMQQRRSAVLSARAGFLENIQEPYPDYSGLTEAMMANAQTGGEATTGGGGKLGGGGGMTTTYGRTFGASSFPDMFSIGNVTPGGQGITTTGKGTALGGSAFGSTTTSPKVTATQGATEQAPTIAEYLKSHGIAEPNKPASEYSPEEWQKVSALSDKLQKQWMSKYGSR